MGWEDDFIQIDENIVVDGNNGGQDEPVSCDCAVQGLCCDDEACFNFSTQIECVACKNPRCKNQRIQRKEWAKVEVRSTPLKHGYGLFACEDIKKDQFILEFLGEVINKSTMHERSNHGQKQLYLHNIAQNVYLDATRKGSIARYTNHSCEPNAKHDRWIVKGKLCIGVFADKDIRKGEELGFDYQWKPNQQKPTRCYCGTSSCRGFLEILSEEQKSYYLVRKGVWRKSEEASLGAKEQGSSLPLHEWLVDKRVRVFWPGNNRFWDANVEAWDAKTKIHRLFYTVDSKTITEQLLLPTDTSRPNAEIQWEWLDELQSEEVIKKRDTNLVSGEEDDENEMIIDREEVPEVQYQSARPVSPRQGTPTFVARQESPRNEKVRQLIDITFATAKFVVQTSLESQASAGNFSSSDLHNEQAVFSRTLELLRSYCPGVRCHQVPNSASVSLRDKKGKDSIIQVIVFGEEDKVNLAKETLRKSAALQKNKDQERERTVHDELNSLQSPMLIYDWRVLPSLVDINAYGVANSANEDVASENLALTQMWRAQQTSPQLFAVPLTCSMQHVPDSTVKSDSVDNAFKPLANNAAFRSNTLSDSVKRSLLSNLRKTGCRMRCFSMTTLHAATLLGRYLSYSGTTDLVSREATPLVAACFMLAEKARGSFVPSHIARIVTSVYCEVFGRDDKDTVGNIDHFVQRAIRMEETVLQVLRYDIFVPDVLALTYATWCPLEEAIHDLWIFDRHVGSLYACGSLAVAIATTYPRWWQAMLPDVACLSSLLVDCVACEIAELRIYGGKVLNPQTLFLALWQVGTHTMRQTPSQMFWAVNAVANISAKIPKTLLPEWFTKMVEGEPGLLDWQVLMNSVGNVVERWMAQGELLAHQFKHEGPEVLAAKSVYGASCRTRFPWLNSGARAGVSAGGVVDATQGESRMSAMSKEMYSTYLPAVQFPDVRASRMEDLHVNLRPWPTDRAARKEAAQFKAAGLEHGTGLSCAAAHELSLWQQMHYYSGLHSLKGHNKNDLWELDRSSQHSNGSPAVCPYLHPVIGVSALSGHFQLPKYSKSLTLENAEETYETPAKRSGTPLSLRGDEDEQETEFLRSISLGSRSAEASRMTNRLSTDSLPPQRFLTLLPLHLNLDVVINIIAKNKGTSPVSPKFAIELCRDLFSAVDHLTACGLVLRWLDPVNIYLNEAGRLVLGNLTGVVEAGGGAHSSGIPSFIIQRELEKEKLREQKEKKDRKKKQKKDKRRHRKRTQDEDDGTEDNDSSAKNRKRSRDERDRHHESSHTNNSDDHVSKKTVKVSKPSLPHLLSTAPEIILGDFASSASSLYSAATVCLLILCGRSIVKASDAEDQHLQHIYKVLGTATKESSAIQKYFSELPLQSTYGLYINTPDGPQSTRSRAIKTLESIIPAPLLQQFSQSIQIKKKVDSEAKIPDEDMSDDGLLLDVLRGSMTLAPQKRFVSAAHVLKMPLFAKQSLLNASGRKLEMQSLTERIKKLPKSASGEK